MKKFVLVVLLLAMLLAVFSAYAGYKASWEDKEPQEDVVPDDPSDERSDDSTETLLISEQLEFTLLSDETYSVSVGEHEKSRYIVVPDTYNGIPVTKISDFAFQDCTRLKQIFIPETVTEIGVSAFENCSSLGFADLPVSVVCLKDYAFRNCTSLRFLQMNHSFEMIGEGVFDGCSSLEEYDLYGISSISNEMFAANTSMQEFVVPSTVASIGEMAFYGCTSLKSVVIPTSVTFIGSEAFGGCDSLTDIYYEGSVDEWKAIDKAALLLNPSITVHFKGVEPLMKPRYNTSNEVIGYEIGYFVGGLKEGTTYRYSFTVKEAMSDYYMTAMDFETETERYGIYFEDGLGNFIDIHYFDETLPEEGYFTGDADGVRIYLFEVDTTDKTTANTVAETLWESVEIVIEEV